MLTSFILRLFSVFLIILLSLQIACHKKNPAPLFNSVGNFHHTIRTNSKLAQRYFDQGLIFLYSFEFGESIRSFQAATKIDPKCAMCYWGLSLALGSKTDMPIKGNELEQAKEAINLAEKYMDQFNLNERLYISALAKRYETTNKLTPEPFAGLCSSYSQVKGNNVLNYTNAMQIVAAMLPNDPDAKTLYAASLFDKIEWQFWNKHGEPNKETPHIIQLLESVMATDPNHPGASHLYVHVIEASPYPKRALPVARRLSQLVPISEHMAHMPAHTYYSLGLYPDAVTTNQNAINRYWKYVAECKKQGFEPEIQYLYYHNIDYLAIAASMEGNKQLALSAAKKLKNEIEPLVAETFFLQKMLTPDILMLARFGEWPAILHYPEPKKQYQYARGIWHYARGLAETQLNQLSTAKKDLQALVKITAAGPTEANLFKPGFTLLQIASNTLQAMIEYKEGKSQQATKYLAEAVSLQDEIHSFDPPPWYFPVRELLGNVLLKARQPQQALQIFKEDLKKNPNNPWSLYGIVQCETALGNNSLDFQIAFQKAWQYADIMKPVYPI